MSDKDYTDLAKTDPLSEKELAETRVTNHKVLREMVDPDEIRIWQQKTDDLWLSLGWIPVTVKNWKAILVAVALAVMIGGQDFIASVGVWLTGLLP